MAEVTGKAVAAATARARIAAPKLAWKVSTLTRVMGRVIHITTANIGVMVDTKKMLEG